MSGRTLAWLAGAVVILVALALLGQREKQPPTQSGALFLPGLMESLDDVDRIELVRGGNEMAATLERGPTGWSVVDRDGYPADLRKIRHTLLSLAEARILEAKTANPALHDRLGVEAIEGPSAGGIAVTLQGIDPPVSVIVGDTTGDYQSYARRADDPQSYLVDRDPEVGRSPADWLDTALLAIDGERIQEVLLTHPDGEIVRVTKAGPEQANFTVQDVPEGRELLYESVANVMGNVLDDLSLDDVERRTEDPEERVVTEFRTFDGLIITAEGFERDDEAWVTFRARASAAEGSGAEVADSAGDGADAGSSPAADSEPAPADPEAEAQELNQRLDSWTFQIPVYKFEQMTRRMSDLLQAQP